ncbi:hypothetical protein SAMN05920897_1363 [Alkalispirochaeta americana]|uniref:Uncharacterized protein n=1 Tax=Alkalispirochaeta americana TaxID=159291 RepID=A0A1N6Y0U7_9SPIO|nr:hypothetical protein [Alkalispirochaeta americana]SIR08252.1 hypothetical protein SAMN05920897_1363 [Alkalispirochaeta americana]
MQDKNIYDFFPPIENSVSKIYQYINTQRYQTKLLSDVDTWNQICSSLWVIGDTLLSLKDYDKSEFPDSDGLKYIFTYGLLQSLFIQQDAITHLAEAFDIDLGIQSEKLKQIREIRNAAIGHPTKMQRKNKKFFNYISRISMSKYFFTIQVASKDTPDDFQNVDTKKIIISQLSEIKELVMKIENELSDRDKDHKKKFEGDLLLNLFEGDLHYQFEKIFSGIFNPGHGNLEFGLSMLNSVRSIYERFKSELNNRDELQGNSSLQYELDNYFHAIKQLEKYFGSENIEMNEKDARIYAYYLREEHKYFHQIASEIDDEYIGSV